MRSLDKLRNFRTLHPLSGAAGVLAVVGLALSIVIAGTVFFQARQTEQENARSEAAVFADSLAQRARIAQGYLRAIAARVRTNTPRLTEFRDFVESLGPEPAMEHVAWLPRVRGIDRAQFEREAQQRGSVGYGIRDRVGDDIVPAAAREQYFPIRYSAGSAADPAELGLDLLADEIYRPIILRALEQHRAAATQPRTLRTGHPGFLLAEPVTGIAREGEERDIRGLVTGMFRLDLLVAAAAPAPLINREVVMTDIEGEVPPLAVGSDSVDPAKFRDWPFQDVAIGGRGWRIYLEPLEGHALRQALIVLLIGLALTGLTVVLADRGQQWVIARDLRREVARQTAALQRSTAEFRALFEEGGTGKCELVPDTQHFRRVNRRLSEMLGHSQTELLKLNLNDVLHPEDRVSDEPEYQALLDGETDTYFNEKRFLRHDGSTLWCEMSASVLRDESGRPVWTVAVIQDIAKRKQAEETRQLLVRELAHRVKNTLQVARSLADQTGRYATDVKDFLPLYQGRLRALAMAHDQLFKTDWGGARLEDIVRGTLSVFGPETAKRVDYELPDLLLPSSETQTLALILNELATNAAKHGALSEGDGRVRITAELEEGSGAPGEASRWLHLRWTESGGPAVTPPERSGFGTTFLTRAVQHQHGGDTTTEWLKEGLRYTMRLPLYGRAEATAPPEV